MKVDIKDYLQKYHSISPIIKAGLWFTICSFLQSGIQFLITPIVTRLLTTEDYGIYSLFTSWINILLIFASLNLSQGIYYNGLVKNENKEKEYTSALLGLGTISTGCVFLIITLLYPSIKRWLGFSYVYVVAMFLVILTQPALGFWTAKQRISYNYKPVLILTLITSILVPGTGIVLFSFNSHLGGYAFIIGYVFVNLCINGFLYGKIFKTSIKFYNKEYWKQALAFSIPLIPHYLSLVVLAQSDRIMVNFFSGTSEAGIYALAHQIALIMAVLTTGINSVLTPWMYKAIKEKKIKKIRKNTYTLIVMYMGIMMIVVLLAPEILLVMGTEKYIEAKWIIPPVMMATFITFIYCMFGTVLFYYEDTKKIAFSSGGGAVLNIVLNTIFIPQYGYVAAGYTSLIAYIAIFMFYYYAMKICCIREGISKRIFDIRMIVVCLVIYGIYSIGVLILYNNYAIRYLIVISGILVMVSYRKKITKIIKEFLGN